MKLTHLKPRSYQEVEGECPSWTWQSPWAAATTWCIRLWGFLLEDVFFHTGRALSQEAWCLQNLQINREPKFESFLPFFWGVELHLTQIKYKQTREGNITPTILLRKMEIKRKILQCMSIRFSIYAQKWLQMQSLRRIHQSFGYLRSLHHEILLLNFTIWNLSRTAIKLQAFLGGKEWRTKVLYLNINWAAVILATEIGIA